MKKKLILESGEVFPRGGFGTNVDFTEGEVVLIPVCPASQNLFRTLHIVQDRMYISVNLGITFINRDDYESLSNLL